MQTAGHRVFASALKYKRRKRNGKPINMMDTARISTKARNAGGPFFYRACIVTLKGFTEKAGKMLWKLSVYNCAALWYIIGKLQILRENAIYRRFMDVKIAFLMNVKLARSMRPNVPRAGGRI